MEEGAKSLNTPFQEKNHHLCTSRRLCFNYFIVTEWKLLCFSDINVFPLCHFNKENFGLTVLS